MHVSAAPDIVKSIAYSWSQGTAALRNNREECRESGWIRSRWHLKRKQESKGRPTFGINSNHILHETQSIIPSIINRHDGCAQCFARTVERPDGSVKHNPKEMNLFVVAARCTRAIEVYNVSTLIPTSTCLLLEHLNHRSITVGKANEKEEACIVARSKNFTLQLHDEDSLAQK